MKLANLLVVFDQGGQEANLRAAADSSPSETFKRASSVDGGTEVPEIALYRRQANI